MNQSVPTGVKWTIRLLSVLLFIFVSWLFGFILSDIDNQPELSWSEIRNKHVDQSLQSTIDELKKESALVAISIERRTERQLNLMRGKEVAGQTMQDFKDRSDLGEVLMDAQQRYIQAQNDFAEENSAIATLHTQANQIADKLSAANETLAQQETPAREEYDRVMSAHRLRVATWKLGFIVPVFLISARLFFRKRGTRSRPIFLAIFCASFLNLGSVMHDYFPEDYFKYIALGVGILAVLIFLSRALLSANSPQPELLHRRHREAYFKNHCPSCAYEFPEETSSPYSCPACGTGLFEDCSDCNASRHSLLPYCKNCGAAS
ncbi:MAG: hypothetical protein MK213_08695 [Planctomycetes bacterium]|nr:hypothetical protein [Planctomycetota bacterium]